jgi:hypothetical protein
MLSATLFPEEPVELPTLSIPPPSPVRERSPEPEEDEDVVSETSRLYHFKILYDQTWDYPALCARLFDPEQRHLCVLEHINQPNTHVHFQGYSNITEDSMRSRLKRLAQKHHLRKLNPKARPTSMVTRAPDEKGFQYMAKEYKPAYVLSSNGFTPEDMAKLKEDSTMHCKELKFNVTDYIRNFKKEDIPPYFRSTPAQQFIEDTCLKLFLHERAGLIKVPRYSKHHTRTSVMRGLLENEHVSPEMKARMWAV